MQAIKVIANQLDTAEALEVEVETYRGFVIREFIWVIRAFQPNPDYCPDPDNFCTGSRGHWSLVVHRLYREVRIKTGQPAWGYRGHTAGEVKAQIDLALGPGRYPVSLPF